MHLTVLMTPWPPRARDTAVGAARRLAGAQGRLSADPDLCQARRGAVPSPLSIPLPRPVLPLSSTLVLRRLNPQMACITQALRARAAAGGSWAG